MTLVDTHCHIHESSYPLNREEVLKRARETGVQKLICVGTDLQSSWEAVAFAKEHGDVFASLGIHPHEASKIEDFTAIGKLLLEDSKDLANSHLPLAISPIVAIGEIGLDYFYSHSTREQQLPLLEAQLQLAQDHKLPVIFHVRDAFDDFWPVFHNFSSLRGVLHSFTDTLATLEKALEEDLFIGVNGISTFTKVAEQQAMFASIPLEKLLFETDAPFLTPVPKRGTINEPAFVSLIASFHAQQRHISVEKLASITTANALELFHL